MEKTKRILPLAALVIALFSLAPVVGASTLTVTLNPTDKVARVDSVSTTKIIFTYPAGSEVASHLENVSSSVKLNSSFTGSDQGVTELQGSFDHLGGDSRSHVSVSNMSVSLEYTAIGNSTALVINKVTNVTAWVTGVFTVVNGTVEANLGWRSFVVAGPMNLDMENHMVDINQVGSAFQYSLSSQAYATGFLMDAFSRDSIWGTPTLNFTALNTPLSTWSKSYNSATNTTTFSKTVSGQSKLTADYSINNQNYTLSAVSDPTGVVAIQGYANAQGDTLVMASAPPATAVYLEAGAGVGLVALAAGYLFLRSKRKPLATATAGSPV
ncbi:MAG: hypothetical protein JRN21_00300 [Nitrososphaerota archaeon]|nr:hypothetical protein [Nitrososphaerota archaeon]